MSARQPQRYEALPSSLRFRLAALLVVITLFSASGVRPPHAGAQAPAIMLAPGWNNVLYLGPGGPIASFLAPLGDRLLGAMRWDAPSQRWRVYFPPAPQVSDLQGLETGKAYWIGVKGSAVLSQGTQTGTSEPLAPGWNNVAYAGPGAPNSATLEHAPVWAWDATRQAWLFHDASAPEASDFANLSPLQPYWLFNGPPTGAATSTAASAPTTGCYPFASMQPAVAEVGDAIARAALNVPPAYPGLELAPQRSGMDGNGGLQAPYVPPTLMRAIAWVESSWHQATWATKRGQPGPTLSSSSCAYGLMQILTGMTISASPTPTQAWVGSDFRANAAAGAQLLTRYWNRDPDKLPYVGRHDPHVLEDWYFTVWAYHCFGDACTSYGAHNNPDDPSLTWPRPAYNSPDQLNSGTAFGYSDYPYQELVYGLVSNPPVVDSQSLWAPIPMQLPPHGSVGFPVPRAVGEVSAHLDNGQTLSSLALMPASAPSFPLAPAAILVPPPIPPGGR